LSSNQYIGADSSSRPARSVSNLSSCIYLTINPVLFSLTAAQITQIFP